MCFGFCRRQPHWRAGTLRARNRARRKKSECLYEVSGYGLMAIPMPIIELDAKTTREFEKRREEERGRTAVLILSHPNELKSHSAQNRTCDKPRWIFLFTMLKKRCFCTRDYEIELRAENHNNGYVKWRNYCKKESIWRKKQEEHRRKGKRTEGIPLRGKKAESLVLFTSSYRYPL